MKPNQFLKLTPQVAQALESDQPVVALESTIITHGMPWPRNLETAIAVENEVRAQDAIPATIAVMDGKICIGLDENQLTNLSKGPGGGQAPPMKLSRADLAFAVTQNRTGSTTVTATMMAAKMAGIEVFATGGIGGVHKGAEHSMDISADLIELSQTNVVVVCAGAKAILDIEKTLEVLETFGVPVITYGSDYLPAFWSEKSEYLSPLRLDDPIQIAEFTRARTQMEISGGILIANPVPQSSEIPASEMKGVIAQAIKEAEAANIKAKALTPWLLSRIFEITNGASLETNIALIKNNARLAGQIATELSNIKKN